MFWPIPSGLGFQSGQDGLSAFKVEVRLLDGQLIHGLMPPAENLSEMTELTLIFQGQNVTFPVSAIRSVACGDRLAPLEPAGTASGEPPLEHEDLLRFQLLFVDGQALDGETQGYLNKKAGGVYLYVRQEDSRFTALWIPRMALKNIRVDLPVRAIAAQSSVNPAVPGKNEVPVSSGEAKVLLATNMKELLVLLEESRKKPSISIAEALFELHLIDAVTLHEMQAGPSIKLRAYVDARLGNSEMTEFQLEHARGRMVRMPEADAETFEVEPQAVAKIPWNVAAQHSVVPLGMGSGTLYVASPVPMNRDLEARLGLIAGCNVSLVWSSKQHIEHRLARETHSQVSSQAGAAKIQDLQSLLVSAQNEIKVNGAQVQSYAVDEKSSIVLLVKRMIMDAYQQKASDIHIETNRGEELSRVRFRKDGELEEYLQLPAELRAALVSRIKVMSKLDISERRRPQDGKISFSEFSDLKLELRVAVLPTHDNLEDVVMRLLASSKPIPLAQLGFSPHDEKIVKRLAHRPYGLILACGPTGSGKTTTLHSLLAEINTDSRKIWTAEDPIEITQPGLRQLQVNPKIGLTFASAMRAFLRADPDVIMIGEVRDEETARISIEASLTGHLVLSTLHTNNAAESIVRLLDLGMDPMNFGDSLLGIVAQRLVRALCKHCKVKVPVSADDFDRFVHEYIEGTAVGVEEGRKRLLHAGHMESAGEVYRYRAVGCEACGGKGYKGRIGIYEILENGPELKHLIHVRATTSLIFEQAIASGTRSLRQDALEKVFVGAIDHEQAETVYS